jgi:hypothetical protein
VSNDTNTPCDDQRALVIEFAKYALGGALKDPTCNPETQERLNEVCDFCWLAAQTMVARMPPMSSERMQ